MVPPTVSGSTPPTPTPGVTQGRAACSQNPEPDLQNKQGTSVFSFCFFPLSFSPVFFSSLCSSSLRTGKCDLRTVLPSFNHTLSPHHRAGGFQKTRKALAVINTSLFSGKQELFQGVDFFLRSLSMGDSGRPPPGKERNQRKG